MLHNDLDYHVLVFNLIDDTKSSNDTGNGSSSSNITTWISIMNH